MNVIILKSDSVDFFSFSKAEEYVYVLLTVLIIISPDLHFNQSFIVLVVILDALRACHSLFARFFGSHT